MMTLPTRCAVLLCAALFVGCEKRDNVIAHSDLKGKAMPQLIEGTGPASSTTGLILDSTFSAPHIEAIQTLPDQENRPAAEFDWESVAAAASGLSPRDADIRFAGLTPDETKKTTLFERELRAGLEALNRGQMPLAIEHFEVAERADPRDFRPFFFEAIVLLQQESVAKAAASLDIAIQLAPDQMELYLHRGNLRLRERDYGLAVDDFSRVITAQPDNLSALINRAAANFHRRRPKDIVNDATAVIKLKSDIPDAYLLRALGQLMQGETVLARRDFESAVGAGLNKAAAESWGPLFRGRT